MQAVVELHAKAVTAFELTTKLAVVQYQPGNLPIESGILLFGGELLILR